MYIVDRTTALLNLVETRSLVSLANLHKQLEALARYYVTSYWQAEWVKKLRWKTIELPSPLWPRAQMNREVFELVSTHIMYTFEMWLNSQKENTLKEEK